MHSLRSELAELITRYLLYTHPSSATVVASWVVILQSWEQLNLDSSRQPRF